MRDPRLLQRDAWGAASCGRVHARALRGVRHCAAMERRLWTAAAAVVAISLLTACGGAAPQQGERATPPMRTAAAATPSPVTTAAPAAATASPTASPPVAPFPGEGRLVEGDGQTQVRLRASRGGAFAITVPAGVSLWVSEPYCLPRLTCTGLGEPVVLVLTTLHDVQSGSLLVLALDRFYGDSGVIEDAGEEVLRVVVPPEGSAAMHAVFDEIVASLTRVEEANWAGSY